MPEQIHTSGKKGVRSSYLFTSARHLLITPSDLLAYPEASEAENFW